MQEACRSHSRLDDHLYLIAVTGYGQEHDRQRSTECGIDLHLLKPVDPSKLETILRDLQDANEHDQPA